MTKVKVKVSVKIKELPHGKSDLPSTSIELDLEDGEIDNATLSRYFNQNTRKFDINEDNMVDILSKVDLYDDSKNAKLKEAIMHCNNSQSEIVSAEILVEDGKDFKKAYTPSDVFLNFLRYED